MGMEGLISTILSNYLRCCEFMIFSDFCRRRALRIVVGLMMLGLLLAGGAGAAIFTVCPSGCTYSSIQWAINAASIGDTVEVQNDEM